MPQNNKEKKKSQKLLVSSHTVDLYLENIRIEKWKTLAQIWDKEADRFWTRNNIFLIVNSALLIVVSSFVQEPIVCIIVSVFGIIFSFFWYRINKMGKYYLDRWKILLSKLEHDDDINIFGKELLKVKEKFQEPKKYKATSTYMRYVTILFGMIWVTLIIYNLLMLTIQLKVVQ